MRLKYLFILVWIVAFLPHSAAFAQEPVSPNGKFVTVNGASIYYEEYGHGEPLLLLHGFGRTLTDWKPYIPELAKHYHVIAWDMRGHGRSSNPDTANVFLQATATKDLLVLMDKLKLKKVKAIGHSTGGITILQAATKTPNRFEAIIPISAQIYYNLETPEAIKGSSKPEAFYEFNELEKQHGKTKGRIIARQFYHHRELFGDASLTPAQLGTIKARTLIVHGENGFVPVSQAWEMYKRIPNAHLFIVPKDWDLENPDENEFSRKTLEFLKGRWQENDHKN